MTDSTDRIVARYNWLRQNPAWETEAYLCGLSPDEFDAAVDDAMRFVVSGFPPASANAKSVGLSDSYTFLDSYVVWGGCR